MKSGFRFALFLVAALLLSAAKPPEHGDNANDKPGADLPPQRVTITNLPTEKDRGCADGQENRDSDLCAQWEGVDATRSAAQYAFWAVLLSAVGTAFLFYTFRTTRRTAVAELRAYVFPDTVTLHDGASPGLRSDLQMVPAVEVVLKNFGSTPARKLRHVGELVLTSSSFAGDAAEHSALESLPGAALPPGAIQKHFYALTGTPIEDGDGRVCLTPTAIEEIKDGDLQITLHGKVVYEDVFGTEHTTVYRMFHQFHWPPDGGSCGMRLHPSGNYDK